MNMMQTFRRLPVIVKSIFNRDLDAIEMLQKDHMKVEVLFLQAKAAREPQVRFKIFEKIRSELERHTQIEETYFYPACQQYSEMQDLIDESLAEHQEVKTMLSHIGALSPSDEKFQSKITGLMKDVEHHVIEEETELFPEVRKLMSDTRLESLARQMQTRKHVKKARTTRRKKAA